MKYFILLGFIINSNDAFSQKHELDFSILISNYSDIGGQNNNSTGNNVMSYSSYGSMDYRLSYYYNQKANNIFAIELEASRRSLPTTSFASAQFLAESYGIALIGPGKMVKTQNLQFRIVTGLSLLLNYIHENSQRPIQKFYFVSSGVSFGSDLIYYVQKQKALVKNYYLKTGFRGSLDIISVDLGSNNTNKPKNGVASLLLGIGIYF